MFRAYITSDELYQHYPRLKDWIRYEHVQTLINSSALTVVEDLRKKQIDATKIYVPLPIDTSGVALGNEKRVVIDISDVGSGLEFTIYGSDDNSTYNVVKCVDGSEMIINANTNGRITQRLGELYQHIKYTVSGTGTFSVYAVDTAFDHLIIYKTLQNICLPILGTSDDARAMYEQATLLYDVALASKYDYDRDSSGTIDISERNVNRMVRMIR